MKLFDALDIFCGGPGSGCHGSNCGRPAREGPYQPGDKAYLRTGMAHGQSIDYAISKLVVTATKGSSVDILRTSHDGNWLHVKDESGREAVVHRNELAHTQAEAVNTSKEAGLQQMSVALDHAAARFKDNQLREDSKPNVYSPRAWAVMHQNKAYNADLMINREDMLNRFARRIGQLVQDSPHAMNYVKTAQALTAEAATYAFKQRDRAIRLQNDAIQLLKGAVFSHVGKTMKASRRKKKIKGSQSGGSSELGRRWKVIDMKYGYTISEHGTYDEANNAAQARPDSRVISYQTPSETPQVMEIARQRMVRTNPDVT